MADFVSISVRLQLADQPQQVAADSTLSILSGVFTAAPDNKGTLYIGTKTVDKDADPPQGKTLVPGQVIGLSPSDFKQDDGITPHIILFSSIWFDGTVVDDILEIMLLVT